MEEELIKRNTDCVYFLASPFTCKKGVECEYRHSDMARLNPRDCWYWLSGNCLNPTCAFRHPPLEIHNEGSTEAAPDLLNQSSMPATKTTVPCYYYYQGFCSKGDQCPFRHEPANAFGWKSKMANAVADAPVASFDCKASGKADVAPVAADKDSILSEIAMTGNRLQVEQKQQAQQSATEFIPEPNTSEPTYIQQCEETAAVKTMFLPAEGSIKSERDLSFDSDQNSEELIGGNMVQDELWESSPGFDVLVDGQTEDMVYEDDPDCLHALDGDDGDCERLFIPHGVARQTHYDERGFFDNGLYEPSDFVEENLRNDLREYSSRHTRDRKARRLVAHTRNSFSVESPVGACYDVDLRDYLRKRRMDDDYMDTRDLRHNILTHVGEGRQERLQRHASLRRLPGRIASKVERYGARLPRRRDYVVDAEQRGRPRNSQHDGYRQYNGMQSRQFMTERRSTSKRERSAQESKFHRPKSRAGIKEDRTIGHFNKNGSVDFEGPKPLSEILKDKKKTSSSADS